MVRIFKVVCVLFSFILINFDNIVIDGMYIRWLIIIIVGNIDIDRYNLE